MPTSAPRKRARALPRSKAAQPRAGGDGLRAGLGLREEGCRGRRGSLGFHAVHTEAIDLTRIVEGVDGCVARRQLGNLPQALSHVA